jgi:hypothetical protein
LTNLVVCVLDPHYADPDAYLDLTFHIHADPGPTYHFDADPDAEPDPTLQFDEDLDSQTVGCTALRHNGRLADLALSSCSYA